MKYQAFFRKLTVYDIIVAIETSYMHIIRVTICYYFFLILQLNLLFFN